MSFRNDENPDVDILIANWNTLPWLRLHVAQMERLRSKTKVALHIWDDASYDGSDTWMGSVGIRVHGTGEKIGHAAGLGKLMEATHAPYVAVMDVDAIPVKPGWLEEAVELVANMKVPIGLAGLEGPGPIRGKPQIHVSYVVFRRTTYTDLRLSFDLYNDNGYLFDVGQHLCLRVQEAGYQVAPLGHWNMDPWDLSYKNRVHHFLGSTNILTGNESDPEWHQTQVRSSLRHQAVLRHYGLWDEFRGYALETLVKNTRCGMYL